MNKIVTSENDPRSYIGYNIFEYPFNKKYPPNTNLYGESYEGYKTKGEGVLLYDFVVMGYDVIFFYDNKKYYLMNDGEGVITDESFCKRIETYSNPMELVEQFTINGRSLLSIAPELTDIEPV